MELMDPKLVFPSHDEADFIGTLERCNAVLSLAPAARPLACYGGKLPTSGKESAKRPRPPARRPKIVARSVPLSDTATNWFS
jgi:hypothetical protein